MADANVSGINPMYGMYNSYANNIAMQDLTGYNPLSSYDPTMSMNGSLFTGMTMPFMPSFGGSAMNYDQYFKNMEQYQDFMYDSQIRQADKRREVSFRANAPERAIDEQLEILHEKIMQNEQEQIIPALQSVLDGMNATYGQQNNANQKDMIAMVKTMYRQKYGTSLSDDIRKYGAGSLTQGFLQSISFGLADGRTAEENISIINDQPVSRWEDTKKLIGNCLGGALTGGLGMLALSSLKFVKYLFKSKPLVAAGTGAVLGAVTSGGIGALNRRASTQIPGNSGLADSQVEAGKKANADE